MNSFTICPCCSNIMLHYVSKHREYWFCRNCWQEMPNFESVNPNKYHRQNQIVKLSKDCLKQKKTVPA